jgi:DNA polymerase III subunit epsilon
MITTTTAPTWLRRSDQAVTWARTMLQPHRAVVIDCETTDLPGAICEVAVIDTQGRCLLNTLVDPRRPISAAATRVHNITDAMIVGVPGFPEVLAEILQVTAGRRVLAYNAPFDYDCLRSDAQRYDTNSEHLDDPDTWGCIMRARSAWVGSPDHFYPLGAAHRAVGDAVAALAVLQAIAEDSGLHR